MESSSSSTNESKDEPQLSNQTLSVEHICEHHEQGYRSTMEDASVQYIDSSGWHVYGVFDGHGGDAVAKQLADPIKGIAPFIVRKLVANFDRAENEQVPLSQVLIDACVDFDNRFFSSFTTVGSTAAMIVLPPVGNCFFTLNVGDSRVSMIYKSKDSQKLIWQSSLDHKPNVEQEQKRIEAAGAYVWLGPGVPRINGHIAVSRAFGDFRYKSIWKHPQDDTFIATSFNTPMIAAPELFCTIVKSDAHIIIGCDGMWDVMNESELAKDIYNNDLKASTTNLCRTWVDRAIKERRSKDNVTVMLLRVCAKSVTTKSS